MILHQDEYSGLVGVHQLIGDDIALVFHTVVTRLIGDRDLECIGSHIELLQVNRLRLSIRERDVQSKVLRLLLLEQFKGLRHQFQTLAGDGLMGGLEFRRQFGSLKQLDGRLWLKVAFHHRHIDGGLCERSKAEKGQEKSPGCGGQAHGEIG